MIIKAIQRRRSVREYKDEEVPEKAMIKIIKAAQFAPTARNNRSWEFVVVREQSTKEKLYEITKDRIDQDLVRKVPVILIIVADTDKTDHFIQDLSIASAHVFLQATELGLGTVWKNIWLEEAGEIKKLLNIPKNYILVNIIPIGYPKSEPKPRSDEDFDDKKIHFGKW